MTAPTTAPKVNPRASLRALNDRCVAARVSAHAILLAFLLWCYADRSGVMFPAKRTLAERARLGLRTVDRAIAELVDANIIVCEKRHDVRANANRYRFATGPVRAAERANGTHSESATQAHSEHASQTRSECANGTLSEATGTRPIGATECVPQARSNASHRRMKSSSEVTSRSHPPPEGPRAPAREGRKKGPPKGDELPPAAGTPAHALFEFLGRDSRLAPIVERPAELAHRLAAAFPGVDALGEARLASLWLLNNPDKPRKNGAQFLTGWLKKAALSAQQGARAPTRLAPVNASPANRGAHGSSVLVQSARLAPNAGARP